MRLAATNHDESQWDGSREDVSGIAPYAHSHRIGCYMHMYDIVN
jgi:hypothetical protein